MSSTDPSATDLWRAARGPVALAGIVLLGALVIAVFAGPTGSARLDPRSPDPSGGRAVAELLRDQGVQVDLVTTTAAVTGAAAAGDTLLVVDPGLLVDEQVDAVRASGADLVVLAPLEPELYVPGVTLGPGSEPGVREPACALRPARRAGRADAGGPSWLVEPGTVSGSGPLCYSRDGEPSLVRVPDGPRSVTLLGNPTALQNSRLGEEGNAALSLGLLGANPRLVWYLPSLSDVPASAQTESFYSLVPPGVWWGLVQLLVAVLLVAAWRARRLGAVVVEPLPVVVRAAETVEGQARLYRRGGARDTAAAALRTGLRSRLVPLMGLPSRAEQGAVVDAVASRARRTPPDVAALLYGAAPPDDAALVRLADDLDALEREVRRP
ncbi:MAG: DUF4350 domain-containing protein [Spirochaetaceae bacterium]|nr:DUF4350 domain-containing protein [Spirochaetaceae bacterium]